MSLLSSNPCKPQAPHPQERTTATACAKGSTFRRTRLRARQRLQARETLTIERKTLSITIGPRFRGLVSVVQMGILALCETVLKRLPIAEAAVVPLYGVPEARLSDAQDCVPGRGRHTINGYLYHQNAPAPRTLHEGPMVFLEGGETGRRTRLCARQGPQARECSLGFGKKSSAR